MLESEFVILFISYLENREYIVNLCIPYPYETIASDVEFYQFVSQNDIVWLDGYTFSEDFKKHLRLRVFKLVETNDIPYRVENVDILFNHSPGVEYKHFDVVSHNTTLYLGLQYALLRGAFLQKARDYVQPACGLGVFVSFGGSDSYNLGQRFVEGLVEQGFEDPIYWVSCRDRAYPVVLAENVHVLRHLTQHEMIHYMNKSKVLLIPSSVLSFEAVALRRPFYTGYFVDNQRYNAEGLKEENLALGCQNLGLDKFFKSALSEFLDFYEDQNKQMKLVQNQLNSIDGYSASRIACIMTSI